MATTPSATAAVANSQSSASPTPASAETKTVNVSLPKHIHDWFASRAQAEDRTINNFITRALKAVHADAHKDVDAD